VIKTIDFGKLQSWVEILNLIGRGSG